MIIKEELLVSTFDKTVTVMKVFRLLQFCVLSTFLLVSLEGSAQIRAMRLRVLFLGNSYTAFNNLPQMTAFAASSCGDTLTYDAHYPGGVTLGTHAQDPVSLQKIRAGNWDKVVLQEQSQLPAFDSAQRISRFYAGAEALDVLIKRYNPRARTYLYMTWGRRDGDPTNCNMQMPQLSPWPWFCSYVQMDSTLRTSYEGCADEIGAAISPVGAVWRRLRRLHPTLNLYNTDGSHPSVAGTYAAAVTMYATLFAKDPLRISYAPAGVSATDAARIRDAARVAAYDSLSYWRVTTITGLERSISHEKVTIWPNPVDDKLLVSSDGIIELYDAMGRKASTFLAKKGEAIYLNQLQSGVYILILKDNKNRSIIKEIIFKK
jgi:hypothetical protein